MAASQPYGTTGSSSDPASLDFTAAGMTGPSVMMPSEDPSILRHRTDGDGIDSWDTGAGFLPDVFPWSFVNAFDRDGRLGLDYSLP